ncbi:glycosyltransferase family 4 protein [Deinococcus sp. KNUC1210]|uniref:glycosyltransferase family 4 protein n=1 Tax=Deinococcus sp. KNUC1210 TaxID=2917691 RepID=UPI001EF0F3E8|nr:glycosyltransferase family 4 protein [Deinococcus sp. KNUC1210]ULH14754.1 glycosyltransferase family 4 protein [Deinococcus sp. KNUC1210]
MTPLRLLFVSDAPAVGGSEVYMREIIPPLRARGIESEVALPDVEGNRSLRDELGARGVKVHAYRQLSELPGDFDLTLLSSWNPGGYRKYYRHLPGPFAALIHDQLMLYIPGLPEGVYRRFYEVLQARDIRQAEQVVTVSRWAADYLRQHHGMQAAYAVPNGVNTEKFRPADAQERQLLRRAYGFSRFTVLVPARLSIEKNHLMLLPVARRLPGLDFVLVGSGYMETPLKLLGTPNLRYFGKRSDMPLLYCAADAVFQPTIAENQSLATLEAMASGAALVTNDIPAQRELIADGTSGLLVGSGAAGYVAALSRLAGDPALGARLGQAARQRVLEAHTLERNAETFAQVVRQITARH